jgi:hypothetical protein
MLKLCADVLAHASCVGKSLLTTAHVQGWDLTCEVLLPARACLAISEESCMKEGSCSRRQQRPGPWGA